MKYSYFLNIAAGASFWCASFFMFRQQYEWAIFTNITSWALFIGSFLSRILEEK